MARDVRGHCRETLDFLERYDILPSYEESGKPPPERVGRPLASKEVRLLAHYAPLRGDLYRDETAWRIAYDLIRAFTRSGQGEMNTTLAIRDPFGPFTDVKLGDLLEQLPSALRACGFRGAERNTASRTVVAESEDSCRVSDLPEPYGKWQQHRLRRPAWNEPARLHLEVTCRLSNPTGTATLLTLELSAPAFPIIYALGERLGTLVASVVTLRPPARQAILAAVRGSREAGLLGPWIDPLADRIGMLAGPAEALALPASTSNPRQGRPAVDSMVSKGAARP